MNQLFVYGSLKQGGQFHHLIQEEIELLNAFCYTRGILISLGKYPALIEERGRVVGELFSITDKGLHICDKIEGFAPNEENLYSPIRKNIFDMRGITICRAIVYVFNPFNMVYIWDNENCKLIID